MPGIELVNTLSFITIIVSVVIIEFRNLMNAVYAYIVQALLMCAIIFLFGRTNENMGYWITVAVLVKVVIIPGLLIYFIRKIKNEEEKPLMNYTTSILVSIAIIITFFRLIYVNVDYVDLKKTTNFNMTEAAFRMNLAVSFTVSILGLYCILSRKDAIKTVFGLCIMENGIHLAFISLVPMLAERYLIGIAIDVILVAFLVLYITKAMYLESGTTDTYKLKNLRW
jgi:hydrogenase-4 component E